MFHLCLLFGGAGVKPAFSRVHFVAPRGLALDSHPECILSPTPRHKPSVFTTVSYWSSSPRGSHVVSLNRRWSPVSLALTDNSSAHCGKCLRSVRQNVPPVWYAGLARWPG